jgi:hypothetical protein
MRKIAGSKVYAVQNQEKSGCIISPVQIMGCGVMSRRAGLCVQQGYRVGRNQIIIDLNVCGPFGYSFTARPNLFQKAALHRWAPVLDHSETATIPTEGPFCGRGLISVEEKNLKASAFG